MSEPFKNIKELYQALINGDTITNGKWLAALGENDNLIGKYIQSNTKFGRQDFTFIDSKDWSIYEEPKWYDNIPECGVLCISQQGCLVFIKKRINNNLYIDFNGNQWCYALPLTKEEVMQYIWQGEDE